MSESLPGLCPECHSPFPADAQTCSNCGYDRVEGKSLQAIPVKRPPNRALWISLGLAGSIVVVFVALLVLSQFVPALSAVPVYLVFGVWALCLLTSFLCFVAVITKTFEVGDTLHFAICLFCCAPGAFIIGWLKATEYDIRHVMWVWTICLVTTWLLECLAPVVLVEIGAR